MTWELSQEIRNTGEGIKKFRKLKAAHSAHHTAK